MTGATSQGVKPPLRQLHATHRASSCAKRGGHGQLCSKPRGARGIEPETYRRRGQLVSRPPTTGPRGGCEGGQAGDRLFEDENIFFECDTDLVVMAADGTNAMQLTFGVSTPSKRGELPQG